MFYEVSRKDKSELYNLVTSNSDIAFCEFARAKESNPFIQRLVDMLQSVVPKVFDVCYRAGDIRAMNVSFRNVAFVRIWPSGMYKNTFKLYDNEDSNIMNATYYATIAH